MDDKFDRLARRVIRLEQLVPRRVTVNLFNIAVGLTTVDISWSPPINGGYVALATLIAGAADLPKLVAAVQSGSKTSTGCTILVVNTAALPVSAAGLDVIVVPASS